VIEEALQQSAAVGFVLLIERHAELPQDLEQEFARADLLALHGGRDDPIVELREQPPQEVALTATVLGDNDADAGARPKRVPHEFERTQMLFARKEECFVSRIGEGSRRKPKRIAFSNRRRGAGGFDHANKRAENLVGY